MHWLLQQTIINICFLRLLSNSLVAWDVKKKTAEESEGSVGFMQIKSTYLKGHFVPGQQEISSKPKMRIFSVESEISIL